MRAMWFKSVLSITAVVFFAAPIDGQVLQERIVFTRWDGTDYQLFTVKSDGSDEVPLTGDPGWKILPRISPDGSRIAYITRAGSSGPYHQLKVMDYNGQNQQLVIDITTLGAPGGIGQIDWFPDNQRLVYSAGFTPTEDRIYIINADGNNNQLAPMEHPDDKDHSPDLSADGNLLAYIYDAGNNHFNNTLRLYNFSTGADVQLLGGNGLSNVGPIASPDGQYVAFVQDDQTYRIGTDGSNLINLTSDLAGLQNNVEAWSPDGSKILFRNRDSGSVDALWLMDPDGGNKQFFVTTNSSGGADWGNVLVEDPSIINVGSKIAFNTDRDGNWEIYLMDPDGSNPVNLTNDPGGDFWPAWSPDGSKIAFASNRDGNSEIYVMEADGSDQVRLTNHSSVDGLPAWSPDGTQIAFYSQRDGGDDDLFVVDADGSNLVQLTTHPDHDWWHTWSPDGDKIAFTSQRPDNRVYVMDATGGNEVLLATNSGSPSWSPDGGRIAFVSWRDGNKEVYMMDADGADQTRLTVDGADDNVYFGWSPAADRLAFWSDRDGDYEIFIMAPDGSNVVQITNNTWRDEYPSWSPVLQTITVPALAASYNEPVAIPVQVGETTGKSIVAAELFIAYDGGLLLPAATPVSSTSLTSAWTIEHNVVAGNGTPIDTLKIALADEVALAGGGDLLTLHFTTADVRAPAATALELVHSLFNDGAPGAAAADGALAITGHDATGATDVATVIPRETITVAITDPDEDLDGSASSDQITVVVANGLQGETLTLNETATPGQFAGSIATVFAAASTAAAHSGDGAVQAKAGDRLTFTVVDQLLADGGGPRDLVLQVDVVGGADGTAEVTQVTQPGDAIYLKVSDADLNADAGVQETAQIVVTSSNGERETVTLTEVDVDDNVFFGQLASIAGASAGTDDDGALHAQKGDVLTATYDDVVTALGDRLDRMDTDQVVEPFGDADGNGQVQAFDAAQTLLHVLSPFLTGLELLQANVDADPSGTGVTPFDAALILQKRVGLIAVFPVREAASTNHPQAAPSSPKLATRTRRLRLVPGEGHISVVADERAGIVAGDLLLAGLAGRVALPEELGHFLVASGETEEGLRVVLAGAQGVSGPGELARVYGVGPESARLVRATFNDGGIAGVAEQRPVAVSARFALHANAPNPFNPATTIRFDLPRAAEVRLAVYDLLGRRVAILATGRARAGAHQVRWDGRDQRGEHVASGVYFYRLDAGVFSQTRRMMLLK